MAPHTMLEATEDLAKTDVDEPTQALVADDIDFVKGHFARPGRAIAIDRVN